MKITNKSTTIIPLDEADLLNYIGGGFLICLCFKANGLLFKASAGNGDLTENQKAATCEFICHPYGFANFVTYENSIKAHRC